MMCVVIMQHIKKHFKVLKQWIFSGLFCKKTLNINQLKIGDKIMLNKKLIATSALVAAASISAPAISDVSVSGYQEWNYIDGSRSDGGLGVLTGLTFKGSGDLDNGIGYSVAFTLEDSGTAANSR